MAKATIVALKELRRPEDVARIRGKQISEVLPLPAIVVEPQAPEAAAPVAEPTPVVPEPEPAPEVAPEPEAVAEEPVSAAEEAPAAEPAPAPVEEAKPKRRSIRRKKDES
jgi:hypothetical protein